VIEIENLQKKYAGNWALRGISLQIAAGKVTGILGENGSGKSTLFKILAGVVRPSGGHVSIRGESLGVNTRRQTAYLPEVDPFYNWMQVGEQLQFLASFYAGWDWNETDELLQFMGISKDVRIGTLSKGQKARLKVISGFCWSNNLVLMDEPFNGIDPPSRKKILQAVFGEFRYGEQQAIVISTHLVSEVEEFIDDVVYLRDGEIALMGSAQTLREQRSQSLSDIFAEVVA
jgi:ABC-2 type transport system ATP-binding protein